MSGPTPTGNGFVLRSRVKTGDQIRTINDSDGRKIQVITLADCFGEFVGLESNPLHITGKVLEDIKFSLSSLVSGDSLILADLINKYDIDNDLYSSEIMLGGSINHLPDQQSILLTVPNTSGALTRLRTDIYYRYQAGKSTNICMTLRSIDNGQANQVKRWGIFDENDGFFFELNGTTLGIGIRSSVSGSPIDVVVNQTDWSIDKLDGTGNSGVILDVSKGNKYSITYKWLGFGLVTFTINDTIVHEMVFYNTYEEPFFKTGQLPLSWEIINISSSITSSLLFTNAKVSVEGGGIPPVKIYSINNSDKILLTSTERPILSIRPSLLFNGIINRMLVLPKLFSIFNEGGRISYSLVVNSTLIGASWIPVSSNSGVEYDVSSSSGSGGEVVFTGYLSQVIDKSSDIFLEDIFNYGLSGRKLKINAFATEQDVVSIYATHESSAGSSFSKSSITWSEVR